MGPAVWKISQADRETSPSERLQPQRKSTRCALPPLQEGLLAWPGSDPCSPVHCSAPASLRAPWQPPQQEEQEGCWVPGHPVVGRESKGRRWVLRQKWRLQDLGDLVAGGKSEGRLFLGSNFEGKGATYIAGHPSNVPPSADRTQLWFRTGIMTGATVTLPSFPGRWVGQQNARGSWEVPEVPHPGTSHRFHVFLPAGKAEATAGSTAGSLQP